MSGIGELEALILMAILRLGDSAYGVSIRDEIASRTGRRLTRGAIYTALRRLERKGFVTGTLGEATAVRGGRAKRFVSVSDEGLQAVRSHAHDFDRMRSGLDELAGEA